MFDLQQIRRAASEEVLRQMPAAVVVAEAPSGKLVLVNERARRLLERNAGWSGPPEPEEIGDFGDLRMFHPDGRPVETEEWPLVRSITSGEEVRGEEHSYLLANGGHLAICSDSSPIRDGEGRVVAGVLIVRDITERKRAEEQIAYHAHLLENVHDAVIATDERFLVTAWNEAAEEMYGWRAKEAVGRNVWSVVPIDLTEAERAGVRREVVEKGRCRTELVAYRKDGTPIETEVTISVVRDERGEVSGYLSVDRDISERKRAEEERQRLASIVQNSSDFIGIADLEWRATFVNEAGQRMVGHTGMEEVRRTRVLDYIMPEDREFVRDEIMPTIMERGNWIGEFRLRHLQTGEPIPVLWDIIRIDDPRTGEPINIATVTRDITERKRAEEELRESEERLRFALKTGTLGSWNLDFDTYDFGVSSTCKANFGLPPDAEFTFQTLFSMIHPDDRERVRGLIEKSVSTGEDYEADYRIVTPAGETRWVAARGRVSYEGDGSPSSMVGTTLDITRRKMDEEEIKTHARQQAAVAELGLRALSGHDLQTLMDDAVVCVARTLGVEFCKIVELLPSGEAGGEELLMRSGVGWKEGTVGNSGRLDPQASFTLASEEPVIIEDLESETRFRPTPLLEEHGIVSGVLVAIPGRDGPFGAMGAHTKSRRSFSQDDANLLQAVANVLATAIEREKAEEDLGEVREAERGRMARDLHDEALQALAYAMTQAQLVQAAPGADETAQRSERLVAALKRVEQQLRGAIYDLRLEAERDKPFSELLDSLIELHRTMAPGVEISLDLRDGILEGPLGTPGRETLRIVGEALTNARRHSGARNIGVSVSTSDGRLLAEVSDDGRGTDPSREPSPDGGMGIKGMRERARALGGELRIESEPAMGTKVSFEMALERNKEDSESDARVLLVEDHAAVREAVAAAFEREPGFEVVGQAGSLEEARRLIAERPVDVAVVDLGLPDGYGGDLIGDLRAANPEAQALVLSASLDRAGAARAVQSGAAGVLHKAAHLDEVVDSVERLRAGETLMPVEEVVELLRFAGTKKDEAYEARRAIESLTPREMEVLQKLAEGLDSDGIAESLHIAKRTQRNHVASILMKLGVHSQLQALVFAVRHGAVEIT